MLTQDDIDRRDEPKKRPWRERFFKRPLDVGPKPPKLSRDDWEFIAHSLRMVAEDNAEVIGNFADDELDDRLAATAERAWLLAGRIDEGLMK